MFWPILIQFGFFTLGSFSFVFGRRRMRLANVVSHSSAILGGAAGIIAALQVMILHRTASLELWEIVPGLRIAFEIDALSALFILLISFMAIAVSIYAAGYVREYYGRKHIGLLGSGLNLFLLSMSAVVTVSNGMLFLIAWELMSLVSFLLVMLEHEKREVRVAGFVYIVMTHFATAFILLAFLGWFHYAGSFDFRAFIEASVHLPSGAKNLLFLLALIGFSTKAGLIPLHVWLPRAHPAAPSHISALMSAVMLKTAVYGLIRVCYDFLGGGPVWWGVVVLVIGAVSALLGIMYGLAENDMKRFLAYSSTENMGIIFMAIGASLIFYTAGHELLGALAMTAALLHTLNHAVFKGLLFMGAGSVLYAAHTKNLNELGGLIKRMPWTSGFFLIGGMALAALPPLNGFVSEWAVLQSMLHLGFGLDSSWWKLAGGLSAAVLGLTGALAAAAVVKHVSAGFLAMPRSGKAAKAKEVPLAMRAGMAILAASALLLGLLPGAVLGAAGGAVARYYDSGLSGIVSMRIPFAGISAQMLTPLWFFLAFVLVLALIAAITRLRYGKSVKHTEETWNCGTELEPFMMYTGTSYSHPLLMIFQRFYRPSRIVEISGEHRYSPNRIHHRLQAGSRIESGLYKPLFRFAVWTSTRIKKIQNGSLQSYLAYMVATLIILLLWIKWVNEG